MFSMGATYRGNYNDVLLIYFANDAIDGILAGLVVCV